MEVSPPCASRVRSISVLPKPRRFGAWTLGTSWWGEVSDVDAMALVRRAVDLGVTFFDTGNVYGDGRSEELLGQALAHICYRINDWTTLGWPSPF